MTQDVKTVISDPFKDPLGAMMIDYLNGDADVYVSVESDTFDMWKMTGQTMFRTFGQMNRIERKALGLCSGKILDVGAGAGSHTLYLQDKGFEVTAMDQSCGSIEVMEKRKVFHIIHDNLFRMTALDYDTLLLLMNGIGIVGTIDGLNYFFQFIRDLLPSQSQVLMDSTDLADLYDESDLAMSQEPYYGETQFVMTYKHIISDPFAWLYIDFETLCFYADLNGFQCEKIIQDQSRKYLARIWRTP